MPYAAVDDVERLMAQFVIGASTKPTTTQVTSIITDIDHEVNVAIGRLGITVPVISPIHFVNWLGLVVSYGATAAILKSMFPSATGPGETPAYAFWESRYQRALKGISDRVLIPSDVPTESGNRVQASTYFTRNPDVEEYLGDIAEPFFTRAKQW